MYCSVRYQFQQHFQIPALKAYQWCTDYQPVDPALMHDNAERSVRRLSESTIIIIDQYHSANRNTTKLKLVNLYPSNLAWTSTHFTGPNKYSQFLYRIVPENEEESHLEFAGLHVERRSQDSSESTTSIKLSKKLMEEDSAAWKLLAKEMERELKKR